MIAGGRTNGEVADALGISLDGAKWHVTELMNRFGVSSREELVEAWESRDRGPGRWLHGLLGLAAGGSIMKAAAGLAAVVVMGAGVVLLASYRGDEDAAAVDQPRRGRESSQNWYIEINLTGALRRDDGMVIGAIIPSLPSDVVATNGAQRPIQYTSAAGTELVTLVFTGPMPEGELVMWLDPWTRVSAFDHTSFHAGLAPDNAERWFVRFRHPGAWSDGTVTIEALPSAGPAPTPPGLLEQR